MRRHFCSRWMRTAPRSVDSRIPVFWFPNKSQRATADQSSVMLVGGQPEVRGKLDPREWKARGVAEGYVTRGKTLRDDGKAGAG